MLIIVCSVIFHVSSVQMDQLTVINPMNKQSTLLALRTKSGEEIDAEMFWKSRDLLEVAVHELLMQFYGKQEEFDGEHLQ